MTAPVADISQNYLQARFILCFSSICYQEELLQEDVISTYDVTCLPTLGLPDLPVVRFNLRLSLLFILGYRRTLQTRLQVVVQENKYLFRPSKCLLRNQTIKEEQFMLENGSHEVGSCFSSI
jgi:hypothetical protein